jgi:hypothetical protein
VENIDQLRSDLAKAKGLSDEPPKQGQQFAREGFPAIAAAAVMATTEGRFRAPPDELIWAIRIVLSAAMGTSARDEFDPSLFSVGGDRSAAQAIPCLLLPLTSDDGELSFDDEDKRLVSEALVRVMTSGSEEVRRYAANALAPIWSSPCAPWDGVQCRHKIAFEAVQTSIRDCRLGPFDYELQRRTRLYIDGELGPALAATTGENLLIGRLTAPIIATSQCASTKCCVSESAANLRDTLLRAHARGAVHWVGQNFQLDHDPQVEQAITESVLKSADIPLIVGYVEGLIPEPIAFAAFLNEIARAATYQTDLRESIWRLWPPLMEYFVTKLESAPKSLAGGRRRGRDQDEAIAALLLRPHLRVSDIDPGRTLEGAKADWLNLEPIERPLVRWLEIAAGLPECVDSIVGFVDTLPIVEQATRGLDFVLAVVDGRFDRVASHSWLLCEWLEGLKSKHPLSGAALSKFHVLVDGLVAHGDSRAVPLQRSLE